jgi:hypothetical protein
LLIVDDDDCKKLRKLKVSSPFKKRCLSPKLARLKIQNHAQNNTVACSITIQANKKQATTAKAKAKAKAKQQSSLYFFV